MPTVLCLSVHKATMYISQSSRLGCCPRKLHPSHHTVIWKGYEMEHEDVLTYIIRQHERGVIYSLDELVKEDTNKDKEPPIKMQNSQYKTIKPT